MLEMRQRICLCGAASLSMKATGYKPPIVSDDLSHELLWIKSEQGAQRCFIRLSPDDKSSEIYLGGQYEHLSSMIETFSFVYFSKS